MLELLKPSLYGGLTLQGTVVLQEGSSPFWNVIFAYHNPNFKGIYPELNVLGSSPKSLRYKPSIEVYSIVATLIRADGGLQPQVEMAFPGDLMTMEAPSHIVLNGLRYNYYGRSFVDETHDSGLFTGPFTQLFFLPENPSVYITTSGVYTVTIH